LLTQTGQAAQAAVAADWVCWRLRQRTARSVCPPATWKKAGASPKQLSAGTRIVRNRPWPRPDAATSCQSTSATCDGRG